MRKEGVRLKLTVALAAGLLLAAVVGLAESGFPRKPIICPQVITPLVSHVGGFSPLALADPCPGNALSFATSNIVTDDSSIRVWQSVSPTDYRLVWFDEVGTDYHDVLIANPDGDETRELVAFTYSTVGKGPSREIRVFFDVFEEGSRGTPSARSDYFVVDKNGWSARSTLADFDGDGRDEIIVVVNNRVAIFSYTPLRGYYVDFVSDPVANVVLNRPAVGNVDSDAELEIVVGTNQGTVLVWDGVLHGSWNYTTSGTAASPFIYRVQVGDIDGVGLPEIVGVTFDMSSRETFVFVWRFVDGGYPVIASQSQMFNLEPGDAVVYALYLFDLLGNGRDELVLGTTGDPSNEKAIVLSFEGAQWTELWSTDTSAATNDIWVGDADGDPETVELVFTGMHQGLVGKKRPRIETSLYIEVFTWTGDEAVSSWGFTGDYQEAWSSHVG